MVSILQILLTLVSAGLLVEHVPAILELIQRCLQDEERSDSLVRNAFGLLGDIADTFPNGEIKNILLQPWIATELRAKVRMGAETRKTMRWAREVSPFFLP
jgi:importin subunit beta-1